ncbi:hypothetical protein SBBP2_2180007 [Burkholderiales bacterium]|nr:hypothetical protein SBBP2_2180007 [Burkholderiales bacterium]
MQANGVASGVEIVDAARPGPSRKRITRDNFRVGDTVSLNDSNYLTRFGKIVRLNQNAATVDCDNVQWRVSYGMLQHVVDVGRSVSVTVDSRTVNILRTVWHANCAVRNWRHCGDHPWLQSADLCR